MPKLKKREDSSLDGATLHRIEESRCFSHTEAISQHDVSFGFTVGNKVPHKHNGFGLSRSNYS